MSNARRRAATLAAIFSVISAAATAEVSSGALTNQFTGTGKCLAPVRGDAVAMVPCAQVPEQNWYKAFLKDDRPDRFRLKTSRSADRCLDIVNDGAFRLTTDFTGSRKCLDVVNDGRNDRLTMAPCGNYTGQMWDLTGMF